MDIKLAPSFVEIISKLFHSSLQIHAAHLQTYSYAVHKGALDTYYKEIVELGDELVETYQGKMKTRVKGYKSYPIADDIDPAKYLESLKAEVERYRKTLDFPMDNINNQFQLVIDLIESTLYFLTFK